MGSGTKMANLRIISLVPLLEYQYAFIISELQHLNCIITNLYQILQQHIFLYLFFAFDCSYMVSLFALYIVYMHACFLLLLINVHFLLH